MSRVLVAEDSPDQALLIRTLLKKAGNTVQVAPNGREALAAVEVERPDLVITDLQMPEMDGLELVEALSKSQPGLPVVLITAYGSEDVAAQALQRGAASYIPKRRIQDELVDTVRNLLAVEEARHERQSVLDRLVSSKLEFELGNDVALLAPLVAYLEEIVAARLGSSAEEVTMQVGMALNEALMNAIHHGNLGVDSELRETDFNAYHALVRQRLTQEPYRQRKVHVRTEVTRDGFVCKVRDEGRGFDRSNLPDPTDPVNLTKLSGRGLYLISTFMDEVQHNDSGNEITMTKRFAA